MTRNTYKKGSLNFFIYNEKDYFVGVCLELDIVVEAETIQETKQELCDEVYSYVTSIINKKLSEDLLNRPAPKEYWDKFYDFLQNKIKAFDNGNNNHQLSEPLEFMQVPISQVKLSPSCL
jgi:hypothetical protein